MKLNKSNYFSKEANKHYMSNSQMKSFMECESKAMAELNGDYEREEAVALTQGSYTHAWNEGALDQFRRDNPQIFLKATKAKPYPELRKEFRICDDIISRIKKDSLFMKALSGKKEVILTANLFNTPWKICIDSYHESGRRLGDLKVLKSLTDKFWNVEERRYESIFEHYGYLTAMALYCEVERLASGREANDYFEPFLACVTKEKEPDMAIVSFVSEMESVAYFVQQELLSVKHSLPRILEVKSGKIEPRRCEICDWCKKSKVLTKTTHYSNFEV